MARKPKPASTVSAEEVRLFRDAVTKVDRIEIEPRAARSTKRLAKPSRRVGAVFREGVVEEDGELFYREDLPRTLLNQLKRGRFRPGQKIDLHGASAVDAERMVKKLIRTQAIDSYSCVLVITGKGSHSPDGFSPVRNQTLLCLRALPEVQAYCWASVPDGGSGAFYVLTKRLLN